MSRPIPLKQWAFRCLATYMVRGGCSCSSNLAFAALPMLQGIGTQSDSTAGPSAQRPTQNFLRQPEAWVTAVLASLTAPKRPSAYPLHLDLGGRLLTFHHEPEPIGGAFREGKDVGDGARGVRHE